VARRYAPNGEFPSDCWTKPALAVGFIADQNAQLHH
jgi:hypothetical protein